VFPRIESLFAAPPDGVPAQRALSSGVASLDALIAARGLPRASCSLALGSSGTGKTTLGLHFIAGSSVAEPGLWCGFFESPERLAGKARAFGIDLAALQASGAVTLGWRSQGEHMLDELGHRLLEEVSARGIRRVVIDGLSGFFESAVHPERSNRFFSCLANELRRRGATVLMTLETRDAMGGAVTMPHGVSGFVDNLLLLRFAEDGGRVQRLLSIVKMRDSDFQLGVHELEIGSTGMRIAGRYGPGNDVIGAGS
jgi:circadian clock protein KaiC